MPRYVADILGSPSLPSYNPTAPQGTGNMLVPLLLLFSILYLVVNLRPLYSNNKSATPPVLPSTPEPLASAESGTPAAGSGLRRRRVDENASETADGDMPFLSASANGRSEGRIGNLNLGRKPQGPSPQRGRHHLSPPVHAHGQGGSRQSSRSFNLSAPPFSHPRNLYRPPPRFSPSPNTTPSLSPSRSPSLPSAPGSGRSAVSAPPQAGGDVASLKVEVESLRIQLAESRAREEHALLQVHHLQQVLSTALSHSAPPPAVWQQHPQAQHFHHPHPAHQAWALSPPQTHAQAPSPQHFALSPSPPSQPQLVIPQPQYAPGYAAAPQPAPMPHMPHSMPPLGVASMGPYTVPPPPASGYPFPLTPSTLLSPPPPPHPTQQAHIPTSPPNPNPGQQFADALAAALSAAAAGAASFGQSQPPSAVSASSAYSDREREKEREAARQDLFGAILRRPGMHGALGARSPPTDQQQMPSMSSQVSGGSMQSFPSTTGDESSLSLGLSLPSLDSSSTALTDSTRRDAPTDDPPTTNGLTAAASAPAIFFPDSQSLPNGHQPDANTQVRDMIAHVDTALSELDAPTSHSSSSFSSRSPASESVQERKGGLTASMTAPLLRVQPSTPTAPSSPGEYGYRFTPPEAITPAVAGRADQDAGAGAGAGVEVDASDEGGSTSDPSIYSQKSRSSFEFRPSASLSDLQTAAAGPPSGSMNGDAVSSVEGRQERAGEEKGEGEGRKRHATLASGAPRSERRGSGSMSGGASGEEGLKLDVDLPLGAQ